jgi:hypothetical protein
MNLLTITHRGRRYEVCGRSCLDRLMTRLTASSTTTTPAINDTVRLYGLDGYRRWP